MAQEKRNKILVPNGVKTRLKEVFNTSYPTVRGALSGEINSELAKKIRAAALAKGGVELKIVEK